MNDARTFSDLVREAFIGPLRSVLIVDDEYPTWDRILNRSPDDAADENSRSGQSGPNSTWQQNPNEALSVIEQFRSQKPGLIIDIHDGHEPTESQPADHLHQSDLLILDYNLEGPDLRGAKARDMLRAVLSNKHFNLVVVHTGEDDLEDVFFECLLGTMKSCTSQFSDDLARCLDELDAKLDELETAETFDRNRWREMFGPDEYLAIRQPGADERTIVRQFMTSGGQLSSLSRWGAELGLQGGQLKTFLYWTIREFEKSRVEDNLFGEEWSDGLSWNNDPQCLWLRTVRGFVTFIKKDGVGVDLIAALQNAIESWQPTPSRLLSAKFRHELTSVGVEAEDQTLLKRHVFAHFYKDFCSTSNDELKPEVVDRLRTAKLKMHVTRQSEAISFHIEDKVVSFGEKIRQIDEETSGGFVSHYGIDLSDGNAPETKKAVAHYNSYISTLPLKTEHDQLDSGHIFKLNDQWWVCATPACDLQPGQNTTAFVGGSSKQRPFTGLRLVQVKKDHELTSSQIYSGLYCFVEKEPGTVICLGLDDIGATTSITNGKVTWRTFVAAENGLISADKKMKVIVPKFVDDELKVEQDQEAEIVAKLRYEYALNYIQKVGTSVTRIGLGYVS